MLPPAPLTNNLTLRLEIFQRNIRTTGQSGAGWVLSEGCGGARGLSVPLSCNYRTLTPSPITGGLIVWTRPYVQPAVMFIHLSTLVASHTLCVAHATPVPVKAPQRVWTARGRALGVKVARRRKYEGRMWAWRLEASGGLWIMWWWKAGFTVNSNILFAEEWNCIVAVCSHFTTRRDEFIQ